ncbi:MAG: ABC transporter permease [Elusimicrobia bacterium]|nr:ABC transporter permease [Elusimicrobiota bacterium]
MFELFVARRYLRAQRAGLFTLVTTLIGVAGVTIGVAALLTTLSVMNGFQADIKRKVVGAQAHITVAAHMDPVHKRAVEAALDADKRVVARSPFVLGQAILTFQGRSTGVVVKGIDPAEEFKVNSLGKSLTEGSWTRLSAPAGKASPGVVLGEELAKDIGAWVGDDVVFISPQGLDTPLGIVPVMKRFHVVGVLKTGYYEYDAGTAYTSLDAAAGFFKTPGGLSGYQARLSDLDLAEPVAASLRKRLGWDYSVRSFNDMNRTLFAALKLEKSVMFLILVLIILVASFNIASNLILLGTEKLRDIGILRAMGATPRMIRRVFLWEGLLIGGFGTFFGVGLGLLLSWVIWRFPIVRLPADIYYLSRVPVQVEPRDVLSVTACGLLLSIVATFYPAWRASRVDPIEAIHYG